MCSNPIMVWDNLRSELLSECQMGSKRQEHQLYPHLSYASLPFLIRKGKMGRRLPTLLSLIPFLSQAKEKILRNLPSVTAVCQGFVVIGRHGIFSAQKNPNPTNMLEAKYYCILSFCMIKL